MNTKKSYLNISVEIAFVGFFVNPSSDDKARKN